MSLKKWTVGVLAGLTLALSGAAGAAGTRIDSNLGVVWLGSLSTGYVVGTDVGRNEVLRVTYTRVPVTRLLIQDGRSGCILFEGTPHIGQTFAFEHRAQLKFTVWSSPPTEWPPMSAAAGAIANFPSERPILDAMQLQILQ